jgi:hypothetical protein
MFAIDFSLVMDRAPEGAPPDLVYIHFLSFIHAKW